MAMKGWHFIVLANCPRQQLKLVTIMRTMNRIGHNGWCIDRLYRATLTAGYIIIYSAMLPTVKLRISSHSLVMPCCVCILVHSRWIWFILPHFTGLLQWQQTIILILCKIWITMAKYTNVWTMFQVFTAFYICNDMWMRMYTSTVSQTFFTHSFTVVWNKSLDDCISTKILSLAGSYE